MTIRRHFRPVLIELLVWTGLFVFAFVSAVFTEVFYEPQWQGRARWSSWPVVLLLPLPIVRTARLLLSKWAIRIDGDRLQARASMWRDFSYRFHEVREVSPKNLTSGRFTVNYTIVDLLDGRRFWLADRYLDVPPDLDLVSILKGENSDRVS